MSCNSLLSSTNADLARFYLLNEESGTTATDLSSVGGDATYARDASLTTTTGPGGGIGLGQSFDGSADEADSATNFTPNGTSIAYSWWERVDAFGAGERSWRVASSTLIEHTTSELLKYWPTSAASADLTHADVSGGAWHHYAISVDNSDEVTLYLDGSLADSGTLPNDITTIAGGIDLGHFSTSYKDSAFAAFALFDAPLSSTEVAQLNAGPEPIWLGTGTHHFNVARGTAYWNCPSTAWGLPTIYNASATDNGALTAEVRIVRDRGKATEAVVATTTGFSGSVACAGSTDNLTLELRVSNDGGYDDSLGDDADGWVSVAWYGLEAKLVGQWNLDEQSGDVARNQVRTLVYEETFDSVGSTDADGDLPTNAIANSYSIDGDETKSRSISGGKIRIDFAAGATNDTDYFGYRVLNPGLVVGVNYVAEIEGRVLSKTGAAQVRLAGDGYHNVTETADPAGEFSARIAFEYTVSSVGYTLIAATYAANASISFEVDRVRIYAENAGTYDRDASNTYLSIADLGLINGVQDFNGSSDEVTFGTRVTSGTLDELSAFAWIDADGSGSQVIASEFLHTGDQRSWFMAYQGSTGILDVYISGDGTTSNIKRYQQTIDASEMRFVGFTFNRGTLSLYVDGVKQDATKSTDHSLTSIFDSTAPFRIGNSNSASENFDGILSTVNIHNRALTGPEIAQLYAQGPTALVDVGRVAHYLLEETSGTDVIDSSASGNDGTSTSDMSTLTTTGMVGRGANLDNTDYISAPWSGGFTYPTSVACAFKLDSLTDSNPRTLLSLTDASASNVNWKVRVNAAGTAIETIRQNTTEYATSVSSAASLLWRTVAVVFHDATSFTLYVDGEPLSTQTGLDSVSASAAIDTLLVGLARLTSPTEYADGITFDEVSAWTRALSAAEAAEWHQFTIFPLAARHSAEPLGLETSLSL